VIEIGIEHYSFGLEAWSIVTVGEWSKLELNRQSSLSMLHSFMVIQNRTMHRQRTFGRAVVRRLVTIFGLPAVAGKGLPIPPACL
jgi:hypothetical protein